MATLEMTSDNFEATITDNEIVLIDFWADWCGPCKMFAPTYEKISDKNPDLVFAKVDTEAQQELAAQFGIRSIPTVGVFRDKILLFLQGGALPESGLEELISRVRELDMDDVRAKIAEHEAAQADG
ncbi:MAG: thioredoxin [Hyphomicrobiales bacterium]|nr:thioredoxin [Hyphomicrobiales bacterium]MCP5370121.1 thioredoxin [Hyphomicrobiales bacterium]